MNARGDRTPKLTAAALFVCAAVSIAWEFLGVSHFPFHDTVPGWLRPGEIAADVCALVFVCAAVMVLCPVSDTVWG